MKLKSGILCCLLVGLLFCSGCAWLGRDIPTPVFLTPLERERLSRGDFVHTHLMDGTTVSGEVVSISYAEIRVDDTLILWSRIREIVLLPGGAPEGA